MNTQVTQLLKDVAFKVEVLNEARKRFSEQLAPEFSLFDFLRSDEMGLSACLACLLDPRGKHGQGNIFLEAYLNKIGANTVWAENSNNCIVETEKQANGKRRIDIFLRFPNGVIGIENKPWALDQIDQLKDYACYLEEQKESNWVLVYLSNREPSESSIENTKSKILSQNNNLYHQNFHEVIEWLDVCASKSKSLVVRIFIEELSKYIRTSVNGELDMSEDKETCNAILESEKNLLSAFQIYKSFDSVKRNLLQKFKTDLEEKLHAHGYELHWNDDDLFNGKTDSEFKITRKNCVRQNICLTFHFGRNRLNNLTWGMGRDNFEDDPNPAQMARIHNAMQNCFSNGKSDETWPWYSEDLSFLKVENIRDWEMNPEPWIAIQNGTLVNQILDHAERVYQVYENQMDLLVE